MIDIQHIVSAQKQSRERSTNRAKLHLDDLQVGQRFRSRKYLLEADQIKRFALDFDPQPFHLDETAALMSPFRGLAASGSHTNAIAMKLLAEGGLPLADGIIGLAAEVSWPRPIRPGDCVRLESEIVEIIPSRSKPNRAVVVVHITMLNHRDECVYEVTARLLTFRKC